MDDQAAAVPASDAAGTRAPEAMATADESDDEVPTHKGPVPVVQRVPAATPDVCTLVWVAPGKHVLVIGRDIEKYTDSGFKGTRSCAYTWKRLGIRGRSFLVSTLKEGMVLFKDYRSEKPDVVQEAPLDFFLPRASTIGRRDDEAELTGAYLLYHYLLSAADDFMEGMSRRFKGFTLRKHWDMLGMSVVVPHNNMTNVAKKFTRMENGTEKSLVVVVGDQIIRCIKQQASDNAQTGAGVLPEPDPEEDNDEEDEEKEGDSEALAAAFGRLKSEILELHDGRLGELSNVVLGTDRAINLDAMTEAEMADFFVKAMAMQKRYCKYRGQGKKAAASSAAQQEWGTDLEAASGTSSSSATTGGKGRRRKTFRDKRPGSASATEVFGGKAGAGASPGAPPPNSKSVRKALAAERRESAINNVADALRSIKTTAKEVKNRAKLYKLIAEWKEQGFTRAVAVKLATPLYEDLIDLVYGSTATVLPLDGGEGRKGGEDEADDMQQSPPRQEEERREEAQDEAFASAEEMAESDDGGGGEAEESEGDDSSDDSSSVDSSARGARGDGGAQAIHRPNAKRAAATTAAGQAKKPPPAPRPVPQRKVNKKFQNPAARVDPVAAAAVVGKDGAAETEVGATPRELRARARK